MSRNDRRRRKAATFGLVLVPLAALLVACSWPVRVPGAQSSSFLSTDDCGLWDAYTRRGDEDRASLTLAEQQKFAILDLRQEVSSGGFDAYLRYWGGDTAELAVAALPVVLGPEWEELLVEAMRLMGPTYPLDPDARSRVIDENDLQATLHALDTRYYDLEAAVDADAAMCAYYG